MCAAAELSGEDKARLLAAYPDQLKRIDGGDLVWRDGTRMPLDDGKGDKPFAEWLEHPDIADMFAQPYPAGSAATPPATNADPGRARNAAFFDKVYGNCRAGEVEKNLDTVAWLPKRSKQRLPFNRINGAARALQAVSAELDELPARVRRVPHPVRRHVQLPRHRRHGPRLRARARHRHRHRAEALALLAQRCSRQGRRARLQE